jgi:ubiquitin-like protein Nedd8
MLASSVIFPLTQTHSHPSHGNFSAQILNLKQMLQEKEGIDVKQIRLIHNGKQLADDKSLDSVGIVAGTQLHMVLALRGGSGI